MDDRETVLVKMEDLDNAVEFLDATLDWEKTKLNVLPKKQGLMKKKLNRFMSSEDTKSCRANPNIQSLLTNMEQESPQSTISASQSTHKPLQKALHHINLCIKKVAKNNFHSKALQSFRSMTCYILQGSLVGICGGVGSGKSSLLSALLGQVRSNSAFACEHIPSTLNSPASVL